VGLDLVPIQFVHGEEVYSFPGPPGLPTLRDSVPAAADGFLLPWFAFGLFSFSAAPASFLRSYSMSSLSFTQPRPFFSLWSILFLLYKRIFGGPPPSFSSRALQILVLCVPDVSRPLSPFPVARRKNDVFAFFLIRHFFLNILRGYICFSVCRSRSQGSPPSTRTVLSLPPYRA